MSLGSTISVVLTLAIVLGVMGIALRLLRKYTMGAGSQQGKIPMEVVQRLTLGQRQGIAVVRVGERLIAVAIGDGGVRYLTDLQSEDTTGQRQARNANSMRYMDGDVTGLGLSVNSNERGRRGTAAQATADAATNRISYVAPLEDFQAVLSMAMNGPSQA